MRARAVGLALAVAVAVLGGCGGSGNGGSTGASGTQAAGSGGGGGAAGGGGKITIGLAYPAVQFFPAILAQQKGLFKKQGLDVDVKVVPSAQLLSSLTSGAVQFGITSGPQFELGALKGQIKLLANWADHVDAYVIAAPGIKSMQGLKGKTMGVTVPGALTSVLATYALQQAGLSKQDVRVVPFGSSQPIQGFISKQVDSFVSVPPVTLKAEQSRPGSSAIYNFHDLLWSGAELAGNGSWIQKHKDATLGVIRALDGGLKAWSSDPKAAKAVIAKVSQTNDPKLIDASYKSTQKVFDKQVQPASVQIERSVLGVIAKNGFPQATPDKAASMIAPEYAREAMGGSAG